MASIEIVSVTPLRDEVTKGRMLARSIIAAIPRSMSHLLPADQLALCTLLGCVGNMTVRHVADNLGLPISTTVELIDRAVGEGRVQREKINARSRVAGDGRHSVVSLTTKAKRERRRARGAERFGVGDV